MFNSIPSEISANIRKSVNMYATALMNGQTPSTNLPTLQKQYTAVVTMSFRKKASTVVAKRLARNLVSTYFEDLIEEINQSKRF
jgi:hypothetical protein